MKKIIFSFISFLLGLQLMAQGINTVEYDYTLSDYYVKENGTGDGSSWEKAMSPTGFSLVFNHAKTIGATFHIAEGIYSPYYASNGSVPASDNKKVYYSNIPLNIIGGYRKDITDETESPSPKLYTTILTGDNLRNDNSGESNVISDNSSNLLQISANINGRIEIYGITFESNASNNRYGGDALLWTQSLDGASNNVIIEKCTFRNGVHALRMNNPYMTIKNCYFTENNTQALGLSYNNSFNSSIEITGCTFYKNAASIDLYQENMSFSLSNSTFVDNDLLSIQSDASESVSTYNIYNNTILETKTNSEVNMILSAKDKVTLIGNVFKSNLKISDADIKFRYNLFDPSMSDMMSDKDIDADLSDIFEYNTIQKSYIVKDNQGYTPTVMMVKDKLSNGTSLRFEQRYTTVNQDQRGARRSDETCYGAFEKDYEPEFTYPFKDITIEVGSSFKGVTYSEIGTHKLVFIEPNDEGLNEKVTYNLSVKADPSVKKYYVRPERHGLGDGSSWKNSISGDDFTKYFMLSGDNVTFYISEGTYIPGKVDDESEDDHSSYSRNGGSFKIYGGFEDSDEAKMADPIKYKTIFSADINNDDEIEMINTTYSYFNWENSSDNLTGLFYIYLRENESAIINGIYEEGVKLADRAPYTTAFYLQLLSDDINTKQKPYIEFENCSFERNYFAMFIQDVNLHINNCSFILNQGSAIYSYGALTDLIENSTFNYNTGAIGIYDLKSKDKETIIQNNTIANTISSSISVSTENSSSLLGCKVSLYNNTIFSDKNKIKLYNCYDYKLIGNIFVTDVTYDDSYIARTGKIESDYNVYTVTNDFMGDNDIVVKLQALVDVLDVKYLSENDSIIPNFGNHGGFTQTVDLLTENIDSDTQITMPLEKTNVTSDQRGAIRYATTDRGAIQICNQSENYLKEYEYIVLNTTAYGTKYITPGIYENIKQELKSKCGADSIVYHQLLVGPDTTFTDYYVTTNGVGDGSSWKEAMNTATFAAVFPRVKNGATFHFAEGVYYPVYTMNGQKADSNADKCFGTTSLVNIIGGYEKPSRQNNYNPSRSSRKYATIFSGDLNNDDNNNMEENFSDNCNTVMSIEPSIAGTCNIIGARFTGSMEYGYHVYYTPSLNLIKMNVVVQYNVDSCEFYGNEYSLKCINNLNLTNSYFHHNVYGPLLSGTTRIESSTIANNTNGLDLNGSEFSMVNTTIVGNDGFGLKMNVNTLVADLQFNSIFDAVEFILLETNSQLKATVEGNILGHDFSLTGNGTNAAISSFDNLCITDAYQAKSNDDIAISRSQLLSIMDHTGTQFILNNQDAIPTVAMKVDTLPDGTSLRIPIIDTITTDQRGVTRNIMTCIGAYEVEYNLDTTFIQDINTDNESEFNKIPTVITLHGLDGKNNIFMCGHEVYIYNVLGLLICHSKNGWDGTLNGKNVKPGIYIYVVSSLSGEMKTGKIIVTVQ